MTKAFTSQRDSQSETLNNITLQTMVNNNANSNETHNEALKVSERTCLQLKLFKPNRKTLSRFIKRHGYYRDINERKLVDQCAVRCGTDSVSDGFVNFLAPSREPLSSLRRGACFRIDGQRGSFVRLLASITGIAAESLTVTDGIQGDPVSHRTLV